MDDGILQPMDLQLDGQLDGLGLTASERESAHTRGKRGLNFSDEELCQLCKSWLAVSEDPRGIGAKSEQFWVKVSLDFAAIFNGVVERTARSLETKWSLVQHSVTKFTHAWNSTINMDEPSTSEECRIEKALLLYRQSNKDNQPFKLLSCWKVLRDEPKWINYNNSRFVKKEAELVLVEGNPTQPEGTPDRLTRAANSNKKQRTSDVKPLDDRLRNAAYPQISPAMAKAAAQKSQTMEDAANLSLFTIPLESLDEEGLEYVRLRRASVLRKLRVKAAQEERASAAALLGEV